MSLTLDPVSALVVIDLQQGIVAFPVAHPVGPVIGKSAALAAAFRAQGLPVVLVNVTGVAPGRTAAPRYDGPFPDNFADLVPELDRQPTDHTVTKQTWGAFTGTDLDAWLKSVGATQVVLTGVATSIGVESTARQAHELGFNVVLVTDAMTDLVLEAHDRSTAHIFPRVGELATAQEVLNLLADQPA